MRFLFVDRIVQYLPAKMATGIKHVTQNDFYLSRDKNGRWYFPSSLVGETLGQLAAWVVMDQVDFTHRPVAGVVSCLKSYRRAYVGDTLSLHVAIDAMDDAAVEYHGEVRVGSELVCVLEGALGPLLPMTDFIDPDIARQQFKQINRPCDWQHAEQRMLVGGPIAPSLFGERTPVTMSFDTIIEREPGVKLRAEKCVTVAAPYFPDHFPRDPVLPMTVLIEAKLALAKIFLQDMGILCELDHVELHRIKMKTFVRPGDILIGTITLKQQDMNEITLACYSELDGKRISTLELVIKLKNEA